MDRQDIYNRVKAHLLQQNGRSLLEASRTCAYRDPNGRKCAIGTLIPDDVYDVKMEGLSVYSLLRDFPHLGPVLGIEPTDHQAMQFLRALQVIHDSDLPACWPDALARFAKAHDLQP